MACCPECLLQGPETSEPGVPLLCASAQGLWRPWPTKRPFTPSPNHFWGFPFSGPLLGPLGCKFGAISELPCELILRSTLRKRAGLCALLFRGPSFPTRCSSFRRWSGGWHSRKLVAELFSLQFSACKQLARTLSSCKTFILRQTCYPAMYLCPSTCSRLAAKNLGCRRYNGLRNAAVFDAKWIASKHVPMHDKQYVSSQVPVGSCQHVTSEAVVPAGYVS